MKLRLLLAALAVSTLCVTGGALAAPAHAQLTTGLNEVGNTIKLTNTDPRILAARIINIVLGVLGIILLTLILYAGFLWMTSGGDPGKIETAQKIIRNAIIGLIIILLSWAIAYYVINVLLNATQGGGGIRGGGTGGGGFGGGGAGNQFIINSEGPVSATTSQAVAMNDSIDITFSMDVSSDIPKDWSSFVTVKDQFGNAYPGDWSLYQNNPRWIEFNSATACQQDSNQKCFPKFSWVYVTVDKGKFIAADKTLIACGGLNKPCSFKFYVGDKMDLQAPQVNITSLYDNQGVCADTVPIPATATDDFGISVMKWMEEGVQFGDLVGPTDPPLTPYSDSQDWSTVGKVFSDKGVPLKKPYAISVEAKDTDHHTGSQTIHLIPLAAHCCDGKKDADEGDPNDPTVFDCGGKDCLACNGSTCTGDAQCASGHCDNGVCVAWPIITDVSPTSGRDGTYVSIRGTSFGASGTVMFLGPPTTTATAPQACVSMGAKTWADDFILVEVPKGAASGPIKVINNSSKLSDTTDNDNGPKVPPPDGKFIVNDITRPGICMIKPDHGLHGVQASLIGGGFGDAQGSRAVGFGAKTLITQTTWSTTTIGFLVPNLYAGWFWVGIADSKGDPLSNAVPFNLEVEAAEVAPSISAITPDHGPTGQYLTIMGQHFGVEQGLVKFVDRADSKNEITGDATFPPECGSGWWSDTQIMVKVPTMLAQNGTTIPALPVGSKPTNFTVYVLRNKDNKSSNQVDFLYSNEPLGPGICRISPTAGPKSQPVSIWGERFGDSKGNSSVIFSSALPSGAPVTIYSGWAPTTVGVSVPDAASTGPMFVRIPTQPDSNPAQFLVGDCHAMPNLCTASQVCCPTGSCVDATDKCPAASYQAMYGWRMTTGIMPQFPSIAHFCDLNPQPTEKRYPSPSPSSEWPGGNSVCTDNAKIGVMFDRQIEGTTAELEGKFKLMRCKGTGIDPCQDRELVPMLPGSFLKQDTIHINGQAGCSSPPDEPNCFDSVTFEPQAALQTSSTYEVYLSKDIKSPGTYGINMPVKTSCDEQSWGGETGTGDCFRFMTRSDKSSCQVGAVFLSPYVASVGGNEQVGYEAMPVAKDAVCNLLSCRGFDWAWDVTWKNAITNLAALVTPLKQEFDAQQNKNNVSCRQSVKAGVKEASNPPVTVSAQEVISSKIGLGDLYIKFLVPQVIDHSPDCNTACINAYIWARFNVSLKLDAATNPQNVQVYQCANENCLESDLKYTGNLSSKFKITTWPLGDNSDNSSLLSQYFGTSTVMANSFIMIDPRDQTAQDPNTAYLLQPNTYYLVRLKGGVSGAIASEYDVLLPKTFEWRFKTDALPRAMCKPDHINIFPSKAIENKVGARELFQAGVFTAPDECRSDGQWLLLSDSFSWAFKDDPTQKLARFYPYPNGIDADGSLPQGCTSDCKAAGASGVFGAMAQCGNGLVETTDDNYCHTPNGKPGEQGTTLAGQACLLMPMESGAGEECDGIANCDTDTCLWQPTPTVNDQPAGTCGNFTVEYDKGEMCDPGYRCFGSTSSTLNGVPCVPGQPDGLVSPSDCQKNGGQCSVHDYLGCSAGCKHLGSNSVQGSYCGNGTLGYGEDCDQGSNNGFGGCSANCLHKGSTKKGATAICGNGIIEDGENCEAQVDANGKPVLDANGKAIFPSWCDPVKCIRLGNPKFCKPGETGDCCGDGTIQPDLGEECDDGNHISGDGCSSVCLNEGSSWQYKEPSFCGNGVLETGESCERFISTPLFAAKILQNPGNAWLYSTLQGNGLIDPKQVGEIVGQKPPEVDPADNAKKTDITATYQSIVGTATFGLQCGLKSDLDCANLNQEDITQVGVGTDGCCGNRPILDSVYPVRGATDVCRNTLISATFHDQMVPESVISNFVVAKEVSDVACPMGTIQLSEIDRKPSGLWGTLGWYWNKLVVWVTGRPVLASVWCGSMVPGKLSADPTNQTFSYSLENSLDADTRYIVRFMGTKYDDLGDLAKHVGITTAYGVVAIQDVGADPDNVSNNWNYTWSFKTGKDICRVTSVLVQDLNKEHPGYFRKANEQHDFQATALALHNGATEKISSTSDYAWFWMPWVVNKTDIATVDTKFSSTDLSISYATTSAKEQDGTAIVYAGVHITADKINPSQEDTSNQVVVGSLPITVLICDNPWPPVSATPPFQDMQGSPSLKGTIFEDENGNKQGPWYNFETMYCRDGATLLPEVVMNPVPRTNLDKAQNILRQYFFSLKDPAFKHDGIGFRIMSNTYHDTLLEWYHRQGFTSIPAPKTIDGYEALASDNTTYVGFPNTTAPGQKIYENILVISHNADATSETKEIYDQMVKNLAFNINFVLDNTNVCVDSGGMPYTDPDINNGQPITCAADWDCIKTGKTQMTAAKTQSASMSVIGGQSISLTSFQHPSNLTLAGSKAYMLLSTGGLNVYDISDLTNPKLLGSLPDGGLSDPVAGALSGNYLFVLQNNNSGDDTLKVVDVTDSANPKVLDSVNLDLPQQGRRMVVKGNYLYIGGTLNVANDQLRIVDITDPKNPKVVGGNNLNLPPIFDMVVSGDKLYAVHDAYTGADSTDVLRIVDISDPTNPQVVGGQNLALNGYSQTVAIQDKTLFVGSGSIQAVNVTNPANPTLISGSLFSLPSAPSYMVVSDDYLYVAMLSSGNYNTLGVIDVQDPLNMALVGGSEISLPYGPEGLVLQDDYLHMLFYGSTEPWRILDVSNAKPKLLGQSGQLSANAACYFKKTIYDNKHVYTLCYTYADSSDEFRIIDVSDPTQPAVKGGAALALPQSAADMAIAGLYAYVTFSSVDIKNALRVIDLSNPDTPKVVGGNALQALTGSGVTSLGRIIVNYPYAYVSASGGGKQYLVTLDITAPSQPKMVGITSQITNINGVNDMAYMSGNVYAVCDVNQAGPDVLKIIDVSNPLSPQVVGGTMPSLPINPTSIVVSNQKAFISFSNSNANTVFRVLDLTNPKLPTIISNSYSGYIGRMQIAQSDKLISIGGYPPNALDVMDVADPTKPHEVTLYTPISSNVSDWLEAPAFNQGYAYALVLHNNLYTLRVIDTKLGNTAQTQTQSSQKVAQYLQCASFKLKLQRDMSRLKDFKIMSNALKSYYATNNYYPQLKEGTFLAGRTNSRWPSWQETFGKVLGISALPKDPVNRFISCGFCKSPDTGFQTTYACTTADDCPSGYSCAALDNFDPQTCWNVTARKFRCPTLSFTSSAAIALSNFYSYRTVNTGRGVELGAQFEEPPPLTSNGQVDLSNWWFPAYSSNVSVCYTSSTISDGRYCSSDNDCKPCVNPYDATNCKIASGPAGSCRALGTFLYRDICDNSVYGEGGSCGDGVIGKICVGGPKAGQGCAVAGDCGAGGDCKDETCELGQTKKFACTVNGKPGTMLEACKFCMDWVKDPKISICHENATCGNGRIDKTCDGGENVGLTCKDDSECTDGSGSHKCSLALVGNPPHYEVCDDGYLNGTYGHCNLTCTGVDKFCGNGKPDPGETCDRGTGTTGNGVWCQDPNNCYNYLGVNGVKLKDTCGTDCASQTSYCGNGKTEAPEECDGTTLTTASAICPPNVNNDPAKVEQPCTGPQDCALAGKTGVCGGDVYHDSCSNVTASLCASQASACVYDATLQATGLHSASDIATKLTPAQIATMKTNMTTQDCSSDSDCISQANGVCLALNGLSCSADTECQTTNDKKGNCNQQYSTVHVRTCNPPNPSDPNQCKYETTWSECKPEHYCGDGVLDAGEECDDGSNNGWSQPCLPTCKQNVCGDGKLLLNVEECDYGDAAHGGTNGQKACQAPYQGTCNDCSNTCKNVTSYGGYCGDGIKQPNEQCDKSVDSNITCPSLGYDYAQDGNTDNKPYCGLDCTYQGCGRCLEGGNGKIDGWVEYAGAAVPNARVTLQYNGLNVDQMMTDAQGNFQFTKLSEQRLCGKYTLIIEKTTDKDFITLVEPLVTPAFNDYNDGSTVNPQWNLWGTNGNYYSNGYNDAAWYGAGISVCGNYPGFPDQTGQYYTDSNYNRVCFNLKPLINTSQTGGLSGLGSASGTGSFGFFNPYLKFTITP